MYPDIFDLRIPCNNCPFRNDSKAIQLNKGRKYQIINDLITTTEISFICHKTLNHKNKVCAGAMAMCEKLGTKASIQQLGERMGNLPLDHYKEAKKLTITKEELLDDG